MNLLLFPKMKILQYGAILILFVACLSFTNFGNQKAIPKDGYVPNKETAVKIAEAIWIPLFGEKVLNFKPYKANLKNDTIWVVEGTMKDTKGGVPYIEINKKDCRVLIVAHGK